MASQLAVLRVVFNVSQAQPNNLTWTIEMDVLHQYCIELYFVLIYANKCCLTKCLFLWENLWPSNDNLAHTLHLPLPQGRRRFIPTKRCCKQVLTGEQLVGQLFSVSCLTLMSERCVSASNLSVHIWFRVLPCPNVLHCPVAHRLWSELTGSRCLSECPRSTVARRHFTPSRHHFAHFVFPFQKVTLKSSHFYCVKYIRCCLFWSRAVNRGNN